MTTNSNGHVYQHSNLFLNEASGGRLLNLGWLTLMSIQMDYESFLFTIPPTIDGPTPQVSVQHRWLLQACSQASKNSFVAASISQLPKYDVAGQDII